MEPNSVIDAAVNSVDLNLAVELCQEVSRIPSVLGEEGQLALFFESVLREHGFDKTALQDVLPDRPNAVGEVSFGHGRRVVLTGHLDTKPVSRGWTVTDPYSGTLIDNKVYGHGIMDMKGALACQLAAIVGLTRAGLDMTGTLAFAATSDHMGQQAGAKAYFEQHPSDLCLLGEPTESMVCLGHRGRYYYDVYVKGRSAHTCRKHQAINANYLAALAVIELEQSQLMPDLDERVRSLFGSETFMSPGRIYGGLPPGGPSMIPDECVIRVDCRPQPGVTKEVVLNEIERCLEAAKRADDRFEAEVVLADEKPGYLVDSESEAVILLSEAISIVRDGQAPKQTVEGWLGDTASFGPLVETVIFGPGGGPVYQSDENLTLEEIHDATKVYAGFAAAALSQ